MELQTTARLEGARQGATLVSERPSTPKALTPKPKTPQARNPDQTKPGKGGKPETAVHFCVWPLVQI